MSTQSLADKHAFPQPHTDLERAHAESVGHTVFPGMTLLEHYAGLAMQGLCSDGMQSGYTDEALRYNAGFAVAQARALIAELEKVQK